MTPGARLTAGLLLAVVAVSVAMLFQQVGSAPGELLFGGEPIPQQQLNRMVAAMSQAGLAEWEEEGGQIRVPSGKKDAYIAAIADAGALPSTAKDLMDAALNGGSVFDSREVKQQRMKAARENQLTHVIELMEWVEQAAVMYEEQPGAGLNRKSQVSASVSILPAPGENLDARRVRNLQKLVAGFHPSLTPERVTVVNLGGEGSSGADVYAEDFDDPYYAKRVRYEGYVRENILNHLSYIPGVRVQVSAMLDDLVETRTVEVRPDKEAVAFSETTESELSEQSTADNGGAVGIVAQGPSRPRDDQAADNKNVSKTTRTVSDTQNKVGATSTEETRHGFTPKQVFASIEVPRTFLLETWRQRKRNMGLDIPDKVDEAELKIVETEVQKGVENAVKPLLPRLNLEDDYNQMEVVFIDSLPVAPLPVPSPVSEALAWSGRNWSAFSMVGVALVSLLMLRSFARPGDRTGSPSPSTAGATFRVESSSGSGSGATGGDAESDSSGRPRLKLRKSESLKDDLSEIVREDPDAAAAILRTWIGSAS